jgi:uncharacterized membrane protein YciS (DUF1049 family)
MFAFGFIVGAVISSILWWIKVRSLDGVISDLKDIKDDTKKL